MIASDRPPPGYRPNVGLMLINRRGLVFAGLRSDDGGAAWQMPQGGIDDGETPRGAARRELAEEVGTDQAEIIAESEGWLTYELPVERRRELWGGRYVGQAQRWFLLRFTGDDSAIDIAGSETPEFADWRWMRLDDLVRGVVAFKRPVYERVAGEFRAAIEAASGSE